MNVSGSVLSAEDDVDDVAPVVVAAAEDAPTARSAAAELPAHINPTSRGSDQADHRQTTGAAAADRRRLRAVLA